MSKLETNQVDPATGTTLTLGTSGDTITIPSGVTIANSGTATGFGGDNTPMFLVSGGSGKQTISHASGTTITYNQEIIDTDNAFASNVFTVPSGEAGKYFFSASCQIEDTLMPEPKVPCGLVSILSKLELIGSASAVKSVVSLN